MTDISETTDTAELAAAIREFETELPGWWWSVCHCQLTRDASCGPDFRVLGMDHPHIIPFDAGFHCDGEGTLADSLRDVLAQAKEAILEREGAAT